MFVTGNICVDCLWKNNTKQHVVVFSFSATRWGYTLYVEKEVSSLNLRPLFVSYFILSAFTAWITAKLEAESP